jgi:processive 1,2-diacylglycerol beta-glucosyltransferase
VLDLTTACYMTMIRRAPRLYRELYYAPVGERSRQLIRSMLGPAVQREVDRVRPTAVVATHPFAGGAAAYLRRTGYLKAPVFVVLTDFAPHPLWIHAGVDHYFVPSASAANRMMVLGVEARRISVAGIPVRSEYTQITPQVRDDNTRRVLLMGGGLGLGPIVSSARSLAELKISNIRVTVVCGQNRSLYREMTRLFARDSRFIILGYVSHIAELMQQADLLITKPGGITCSEALAVQLPMLLLPPLPGHEEENATHLVNSGAAELAVQSDLSASLYSLLWGPGERLARLRESARIAGRPGSAQTIANEIIILSTPNRHKAATG